MACNLTITHEDDFPNKFRIQKRKPYQLYGCGLKTHPTIVPRSGLELTTSRLHSFNMAKVSHALNHSAMEVERTTSCLHSFIMAKVSHALSHSAMEAVMFMFIDLYSTKSIRLYSKVPNKTM